MKIINVSTLDTEEAISNKDLQAPITPKFTPLEAQLAEIWQEVLGVTPENPETNFFELGGNSLSATQVVARVRILFEINFPLQDFFVAPSLAEMAANVDTMVRQGSSSFILPTITPVSRDQVLPLSFSQERMWFVHHLDPASTAYNVVSTFRLKGKFNHTAMQQSLNELISRHESLRTTFPAIEGRPIQRIAPSLEITITHFDLRNEPSSGRETQVNQILTAEAARPFDIETGPLIRAVLLTLEEDEFIVLLNLHHLITDAWSMTIFDRELEECYQAFDKGTKPDLPPLKLQFADYAYWQRDWLQGEVLEAHLAYWRHQLSGVVPLNLPTDHPRPAIQTYRGSFVAASLPDDLPEGLRRLAIAEGVTPFMIELAAFQVLLYRYTGQTDLVVGTPVANREWLQSELLIGSLVTTLPVRAKLDGKPIFRDFLQQVRQTALDAYTYQNIPFTRLVEKLNPIRDTSYSPLTQVMFNVINMPVLQTETAEAEAETDTPENEIETAEVEDETDTPENEIEVVEVDRLGAQFELGFNLVDMPTQHNIRVEYNVDLFERPTVERMLAHYLELLQAIVLDPSQPVDKLPMLTASERQLLLEEYNATYQPFDQTQTLTGAFESQVRRTPQAPALLFGETSLTYAQLDEQVNQLACYLVKKDLQPGTRIGLCLPRSYNAIVAILAVLKAGCTYVPLDPAYPQTRLEFMIQDAELALVICQEETAELARQVCPEGGSILDLTAEKEAITTRAGLTEPVNLASSNIPAYVTYTSGSTGQPKGVIGTQYGILNRAAWMWRNYPFEAGEVLSHRTSLNFVDAVWEIFGPLLKGWPLVILPDAVVKDPDAFVKALAEYRISRLTVVPSLLRALLETHPGLGDELPDLRLVISSGEVLPASLAQQFVRQLPGTRLLNLYGSSEASGDSTYYEVGKLSPQEFIPLGKPMDNVKLYVVDPQLQPVPPGIPGELYIGGMGVASGYLNRPELTATRFVADPFNPGERLYRTGDWVRYLPDGNLQYLGRQDDQVKVRGMRITLGEVTEGLKLHPGVAQAAVVVREDQSGNNQLAGFLVAREDTELEVAQVRTFLVTRLPGHMVPARLEILPELPLTPNGKIDKQALIALVNSSSVKAEADIQVLPGDEVEQRLLSLWRVLLEQPEMGMTGDFFAYGGHSLLAVRLFAEIEKEFGVKLPLASLFQTPTPLSQAENIRARTKKVTPTSDTKSSPLVAIQPNGSKPPFYCVHDVGGSVLRYASLASHLGEDQPFYGLDALVEGPEPPSEIYSSVENIARYYIEAIQAFQPEGPYYLGGYSYGAGVAYEIARQLTEMGHSIGLLAIFDFPAPKSGYEIAHLNWTFFRGLIENIPHWGREFIGVGDHNKGPLDRIRWKIEAYVNRKQKKDNLNLSSFQRNIISGAPIEYQSLITHLFRTMFNYIPAPYPGRATVFRSPRQPLICSYDPHLGWDKLARGGVEMYPVSGIHQQMLDEPNVQILAAALKKALADAAEGKSKTGPEPH